MIRLALILTLLPAGAWADTVLAARTLRAETVLTAQDVKTEPGETPGALDDPLLAVGMEARVTLYSGRPIRPEDLGAPAIVDLTEGRALGRGGVGDTIRVMNLSSRTTVTGRIAHDGQVLVGQGM